KAPHPYPVHHSFPTRRSSDLNSGAALMPQPVLEAVVNHVQLEATIGAYEANERELEKVEHVYDAAARLINCAPDEIAFMENATRSEEHTSELQSPDHLVCRLL